MKFLAMTWRIRRERGEYSESERLLIVLVRRVCNIFSRNSDLFSPNST